MAIRDLDRQLRDRTAVIVDIGALADLPRTALLGADPVLLSVGDRVSPTAPAPLLRLLLRARSVAVPCAVVAPRLGSDLVDQLTALRVANLWSAAVYGRRRQQEGTNPYRAAAEALGLSIERCLVVGADPMPDVVAVCGARRILVSRGGVLRSAAATARALLDKERDLAQLLALGHTTASAAAELGRPAATLSSLIWDLNKRFGFTDRTRTVAHLITAGLLDSAPLRAALTDSLPPLDPSEHRALRLLASHDTPGVGREMGLAENATGDLIRRAVARLGARNRTHAVTMVLMADRTAAEA
ncbi:hypothetical protein [Kitasatospora sp. NPDC047058]|uniref:hypothetical protein n=1 Tax=Kitasatospora sp. NPDC047058 TaxID=3155620 RepID=UPI0033E42C55